jgi:hypothetical protein
MMSMNQRKLRSLKMDRWIDRLELVPLVVLLILSAAAMGARGEDGPFVRINQLARTASPARVVMVTNINPTVVFTNVAARADGRVVLRRAQNMGITPVFYALGTTNVSTNSFHGVLAGGTAFNNGTGATVDFGPWSGSVTMLSHTGTNNVATTELLQ